jgi:hypothetical protein
MFPTLEAFCAVMDQTTENFECLVINNNAKTNKLQEQIFWYKAENARLQLGCRNTGTYQKIWGPTTKTRRMTPKREKVKSPANNREEIR